MSWAKYAKEKLSQGESCQLRPRGNSMNPKIKSGQLVTLVPIEDPSILQVGDIVLCRVNGRDFLHLIKATREGQFQIGNNKGHINGWVSANGIFGLMTRVED